MISVIDYGVGNLRSVEKALQYIGCDAKFTSDKKEIEKSEGVVLPGVGAFDDAMLNLQKSGLDDAVKESINSGKPFLGICLGLQLLFEKSEESKTGKTGLCIFKGTIKKIPEAKGLKIPHMGWNEIEYSTDCPFLTQLPDKPYVYFVHSYYADCVDKDIVAATVQYGGSLDVAVYKNNVFATQFHPEKSSLVGLNILRKWALFVKSHNKGVEKC